MDSESQTSFQESTMQNDRSPQSGQQGAQCALCWSFFIPDNEVNGVEPPDVCGNCEIAYLANTEPTISRSHQRRIFRGRRPRNDSSESIEDLFSQQFSHLINSARQNQHSSPISASEQEVQLDGDTPARLLQTTSSRTTPSGSRRWWRSVSDNESEGFDNADSVFGEREFYNFGGYGSFVGEGDTVSHSAYGGGSDISVDVHTFLDRETLAQPDDGSDLDSDTDIDPMHAGLDQWNSDDQDEDEEWGEVNPEENTVETIEGERWVRVLGRRPNDNRVSSNWLAVSRSRVNGGPIRWRFRENRRPNLEESRAPSYVGNSGDYLDAIGFEQLLEQLAEADSTRRGAPPAAPSFVDSLPCVIIDSEHVKHGDLICAVCKDPLSIGTTTKQLPCMHLYHPYCILPWLSTRNSCPLCRYELPTDDKDYEEGKRTSGVSGNRTNTREIEIMESEPSEDSSDDLSDGEVDEECEVTSEGDVANVDCDTDSSSREPSRGGWFFLATPIVSLVGIVLVFWFRNPLVGSRGYCGVHGQGQEMVNRSSGNSRHGQGITRNRRWWPFF